MWSLLEYCIRVCEALKTFIWIQSFFFWKLIYCTYECMYINSVFLLIKMNSIFFLLKINILHITLSHKLHGRHWFQYKKWVFWRTSSKLPIYHSKIWEQRSCITMWEKSPWFVSEGTYIRFNSDFCLRKNIHVCAKSYLLVILYLVCLTWQSWPDSFGWRQCPHSGFCGI